MMELYAKGIRDNAWMVTDALDGTADQMTRSIPIPTVDAINNAAAGVVNGMAAAGGGAQPAQITLQLENGREIARWLLPDIRSLQRSSPEVRYGV